jgi:hypothetical protein
MAVAPLEHDALAIDENTRGVAAADFDGAEAERLAD